MKKVVMFLLFFAVLVSCGGNDAIEIGNKTTLEVEPLYDAGKVVK
jgi:hypothetical protein